jgi:hypothetical protein
MSGITLQGLLLFLCIPLVLFLFLRQPLGPGWSVALGVAIMGGHRFLAAPWMAKFADVRCLWCGRVAVSTRIPIVAGGRLWELTACSQEHAGQVARFLRFLHRFRTPVRAGIVLPLAWLLVASLASAAGRPLLPHDTNALIFRVLVAATVLSAATVPFVTRSAGPARSGMDAIAESQPLRCPLPLHNLFLLGIRNTLWIFRVVGAWWVVDGAARLWR